MRKATAYADLVARRVKSTLQTDAINIRMGQAETDGWKQYMQSFEE